LIKRFLPTRETIILNSLARIAKLFHHSPGTETTILEINLYPLPFFPVYEYCLFEENSFHVPCKKEVCRE
jgi:hypothetical protein